MSTIGNSQISQAQLDAGRNAAAAQRSSEVKGPADTLPVDSKGKPLLSAGSLSTGAAAGSLALSQASLDGVNWDALAADMTTTDTMSISISDIMVLLVSTMSEMRKGQREAWMAEAQNSLAMGLNAADRMRESAAAKLACDCITNGVTILTAAAQMATQGASMVKQAAVSKAVDAQVEAAMKAQQRAMESAQTQTSQVMTKGLSQESVNMSDEAMQGLKWNDNPLFVSPDKALDMADDPVAQGGTKLSAASQEVFDHLEPKTPDAAQSHQAGMQQGNAPKSFDAKQAQLDAKEMDIKMWATQEKARLMGPFNAKVELINKGFEIAGALGKTGAAVGEYFSGVKQAEAQEARSRGEYASNIAQVELDFANELRDTMRSALDAMKSVEASRHQAMQGIYNI